MIVRAPRLALTDQDAPAELIVTLTAGAAGALRRRLAGVAVLPAGGPELAAAAGVPAWEAVAGGVAAEPVAAEPMAAERATAERAVAEPAMPDPSVLGVAVLGAAAAGGDPPWLAAGAAGLGAAGLAAARG
ncbi:MAG: hypothetical protein ABI047_02345 [Jatrophihabitantaceae bacterium]